MKQDRRYLCFMLIACTGAFAVADVFSRHWRRRERLGAYRDGSEKSRCGTSG